MDQLDEQWLRDEPRLDWRPLSLPRPPSEWMGKRARLATFSGLALLHVLVAAWLLADRTFERDADDDARSLLVDFIMRAPVAEAIVESEPDEIIVIRPPPMDIAPTPAAPIRPTQAVVIEQAPTQLAVERVDAPDNPLRLYSRDGSLLLPDDLLEQIDRTVGDKRDFSFQRPGLDGMEKLLSRPQALTYEATRFEAGWRPETDLLTDLLEKALEKTSPEIRIPVPGRPGARLVCRVVVLAAGGGCWFESNDDGYQVVLNDPATLNEEEQKQCQAWWDKITGASSQEVWRKTRALYDAECRKPLEKKSAEAALPIPDSD